MKLTREINALRTDLMVAQTLLREARPYLAALDNLITNDGPMRDAVRELWSAIDTTI